MCVDDGKSVCGHRRSASRLAHRASPQLTLLPPHLLRPRCSASRNQLDPYSADLASRTSNKISSSLRLRYSDSLARGRVYLATPTTRARTQRSHPQGCLVRRLLRTTNSSSSQERIYLASLLLALPHYLGRRRNLLNKMPQPPTCLVQQQRNLSRHHYSGHQILHQRRRVCLGTM